MKVGLIHYSCPPVVGGVEFVLLGQARQFASHRHRVRIIVGNGAVKETNIRTNVVRVLRSTQVRDELARGIVSPAFYRYRDLLIRRLRPLVRDLDVVIVHNVMSMHFNLALTAAIWELARESKKRMRWYFWTHDLTLENPDYPRLNTRIYPFSLLITRHPKARYIAISQLRQRQLAKRIKTPLSRIKVVPNGVDVRAILDLDPLVWNLHLSRKLYEKDLVLFFPTRILPRKNLESAVLLTGALKRLGKKAALVVTGAPDPHNADSVRYFAGLRRLIRKSRLSAEVIFVKDLFDVGFPQLQGLFRICDAVLMTSRQEGFGLPLLEAGAYQKIVICPRRAPFTELVGKEAIFLEDGQDSGRAARRIVREIGTRKTWAHFKRVLKLFSWEAVWRNHLSKLLS